MTQHECDRQTDRTAVAYTVLRFVIAFTGKNSAIENRKKTVQFDKDRGLELIYKLYGSQYCS